jgi:hypothetical protein
MGFSLEEFIQELEEVLAHDWPAEDKIKRLEELIASGRKYAEECNQI